MKNLLIFSFLIFSICIIAQDGTSQDYLSSEFHQGRREALRAKMPANSVAVFFANPVRNRANDVDYVYHQDPDFYYLTGYKEPHAVLVIFSEEQVSEDAKKYDEVLYVQEKNPQAEMWTGYRLGVEGAINELGFNRVFNGKDFLNNAINFSEFESVLHKPFTNDYRDSRDPADLASLVQSFKNKVNIKSIQQNNDPLGLEVKQEIAAKKDVNVDTESLYTYMGELRQIKSPEEMKLLKKAVRISAMGQIEVMKAMHPGMSETEVQGIHEYVFKKYGSEYEGYPSIVGAGNNGCVLHYIENNKTKLEQDLVLMDLGAEYHGYTADVTRTIPANGKYNAEQKAIYDLVYEAQEAGIAAAVVGNNSSDTHKAGLDIINKGLYELGIISSPDEQHRYFPHGTSHHIGLDVHDLNTRGSFQPNMVITVEPGIYIPEGSDCDEKWWGIAVRIEDDILITENGPVNLSSEAPRRAEEIEAMMKKSSIFDKLSLPELD
ncbi:aminopeptidase P N-terminal domain-containing protein [Gramella sp. MAR_2010_147]|uniref:aminopeptidase P N-terminal domain-containing protein n=1 Tax=Gramella sp. MAR_2010_147 TaxID=1250205 RepID=UPI00087CAD92|nr:aminopeptidase P N-terminal domain-containing protein [Gramella sp. MAR_2010_147]SDR92390.1 aminopeptidase P Metallo peptidase. MEROPS family M24B [Gramella sp. MAR_2010_147]